MYLLWFARGAFPGLIMLLLWQVCVLAACGSGDGSSDAGLDGADAGTDAAGDAKEVILHSMSVAELHTALENKDFLLICVHVPREGEIPGTDTHIPYTDIDALASYIGAYDTKAVLYCKSDAMSLSAGRALVERGYSNIYYLEGGMNAWQAAGYKLDP